MATGELAGPVSVGSSAGRECRAILIPEPNGGFSIVCISLPGVASQGETEDEAIAHLREAFVGALQSYQECGMPVPWSSEPPVDRPANSKEVWIVVNA